MSYNPERYVQVVGKKSQKMKLTNHCDNSLNKFSVSRFMMIGGSSVFRLTTFGPRA